MVEAIAIIAVLGLVIALVVSEVRAGLLRSELQRKSQPTKPEARPEQMLHEISLEDIEQEVDEDGDRIAGL